MIKKTLFLAILMVSLTLVTVYAESTTITLPSKIIYPPTIDDINVYDCPAGTKFDSIDSRLIYNTDSFYVAIYYESSTGAMREIDFCENFPDFTMHSFYSSQTPETYGIWFDKGYFNGEPSTIYYYNLDGQLTRIFSELIDHPTYTYHPDLGYWTHTEDGQTINTDSSAYEVHPEPTVTLAYMDPLVFYAEGSTAKQNGVAIDEAHFPDPVFRQYLADNYGWSDGEQQYTFNVNHITSLLLERQGVTSVQGIEYFPNLTELDVSWNEISSLDLGKCEKLKSLTANGNPIKTIDVSGNANLEVLNVYQTQITEIDVSKNTKLQQLSVGSTSVSTLDISNNHEMKYLYIWKSDIQTIDLSQAPLLEELYCYEGALTELDITHNPMLNTLYCYKSKLTGLDVSRNPELTFISCFSSQLTALDVSNNPKLKYLYCYDNQISSLDVSHNPDLERLWCQANQLTSLDLSQNIKLTELKCDDIELTGIQNPDIYIEIGYVLISKPVEEYINAGVTVYLNMDFWDLTGALDANGNAAPRLVPITDETMYRDTYVTEGEDEDWVSAKYLFDTYLAPGKAYESYGQQYLYVRKDTRPTATIILPASTTTIESQAFTGIPEKVFRVPATVSFIAEDAFDATAIMIVEEGSYAETRCGELGLTVYVEK